MDKQVPGHDQSCETPLGTPPSIESLSKSIEEKRTKIAGIYEVYMAACVIWNRENAKLTEMEDKLMHLKQGQFSL